MKPILSDIIIGTAQFGMDYGVSNTYGKTSLDEASSISSYASKKGMYLYDTAPDYGDSHQLLRKIMKDNRDVKVITKISPLNDKTIPSLIQSIRDTCEHFEGGIEGILFHRPDDVFSDGYHEVIEEVTHLKKMGLVNKVGVSIYDREQLNGFMKYLIPDIVQLPFNIFDQRFSKDVDIFSDGMEIHVRSIFLQGMLLMPSSSLPSNLKQYERKLQDLRSFSERNGISIYDLSVKWAVQQKWIDKLVVGFARKHQLESFEHTLDNIKLVPDLDLGMFSSEDINLINPSRW